MEEQVHHFGKRTEAELTEAAANLMALRQFRTELAAAVPNTAQFFEPNQKLEIEARKDRVRKLKYMNQTSMMQSLLLKHELTLKLLVVLDGYILAVENRNAILTFLSARYLLELLATVTSLLRELEAAKRIDVRDWEGRGRTFLAAICRGRYGASDPKIVQFLKSVGVSASSIQPFNITRAIKSLGEEVSFSTAVADYDYFSNICHHNGSAHQLFQTSMRETTSVITPFGSTIVTATPSLAVTLEYPLDKAFHAAFINSVGAVHAWGIAVKDRIAVIPDVPFSETECRDLTGGALASWATMLLPPARSPQPSSLRAIKVGRNDPCPCGSGKKYKRCCLTA